MASISVKGTAERIFFNGCGVDVTEKSMSQSGELVTRRYTAWFNEPVTFPEGTTGKFSGLMSLKIEDWTDKDGEPKLDMSGKPGRSIKVSINNCKFAELSFADPLKVADQILQDQRTSATAESWTPPMTSTENLPF
jgi:hypothetical protein